MCACRWRTRWGRFVTARRRRRRRSCSSDSRKNSVTTVARRGRDRPVRQTRCTMPSVRVACSVTCRRRSGRTPTTTTARTRTYCRLQRRKGENHSCYLLLLFRLSGRCCLDGSSKHQPIVCCLSHSPDTCPHPVLHILLPRSLWPSSVSLPFHFSFLYLFFQCLVCFYVSEILFAFQ